MKNLFLVFFLFSQVVFSSELELKYKEAFAERKAKLQEELKYSLNPEALDLPIKLLKNLEYEIGKVLDFSLHKIQRVYSFRSNLANEEGIRFYPSSHYSPHYYALTNSYICFMKAYWVREEKTSDLNKYVALELSCLSQNKPNKDSFEKLVFFKTNGVLLTK